MKLEIISVSPTDSTVPYTDVGQVVSDYMSGKPVIVRGYGPLSGLTIDRYEESSLKDLGYTHIEVCLGSEFKELPL